MSTNECWFEASDEHLAGVIKEEVSGLLDDQSERNENWKRWYRQYRDPKMSSLALSSFPTQLSRPLMNLFRTPLTLNIAQSIPDAFISKVGKTRERMMYTVRGGRRRAREQARLLQMYDDGIKNENNMYDVVSPQVKLDSGIFGIGYYHTYWDNGPKHERVFAPEILVDSLEGMDRQPRTVRRLKFFDRRVVAHRYKEAASKVMDLPEGMDGGQDLWWRDRFDSAGTSDLVLVVMSVHLPSGPGANDGKIALTCGDVLLKAVPWKHDWHPFTALRFIEPPDGWDGIGIVEKVSGIQYEISRLVRAIQSAHSMLSHPFIFIEKSSSVNPAHIRGISGTMLSYVKTKPSIEVPQVVHPEIYRHLDWMYAKGFEVIGMPEVDVQGKPHPGMESARAELVAGEKTSDRFTMYQRQSQRAMRELTEKQFALCAEHNYKTNAVHRSSLKAISWKDIKVKMDDFVIRAQPAGIMPDTVDGQFERIEQLRNSGLVTEREDQLDLMDDFPDLNGFMERQLGMRKYIETSVGRMLDGGDFVEPIPEIDTKQALAVGVQMFVEAHNDEVDDEDLRKVEMWLEYVRQMDAARSGPLPAEQDRSAGLLAGEQVANMAGAPPSEMVPPEGVGVLTPEAGGAAPPPPGAQQIAAAMMPGGMPNA